MAVLKDLKADDWPTSFPGSFILLPPGASEGLSLLALWGGKMRNPGNEVDDWPVVFTELKTSDCDD